MSVAGSSNLLLDLAFHPITGALLVIDFGHQQVLTVDPRTGASTIFATIPGGAAAGPNVLTFDQAATSTSPTRSRPPRIPPGFRRSRDSGSEGRFRGLSAPPR